jgi:hypothetical protein
MVDVTPSDGRFFEPIISQSVWKNYITTSNLLEIFDHLGYTKLRARSDLIPTLDAQRRDLSSIEVRSIV